MHVNDTRIPRLRDIQPKSRHARIKGDESFPQYSRIISIAKEYVRRKRVKDSAVAEDFVERIVSRALAELKPESLGDDFDDRVRKTARRVFDEELQHHRWTEPATEAIPSSLPERSNHGTTERVLRDENGNPRTRRPSRSKVVIASPVKLKEPDEDGCEWTSVDDLAFADASGHLGGSLRQNKNIVEGRSIAKLDRDNSIRRLVRVIALDDLRFVVAYLQEDIPKSSANRTRWSRLKKRLCAERLL